MKNRITQFICIILFLNSVTIFSQTAGLETETAFMNCIYESLPDKGEKMRSIFNEAEQKLIQKRLLKNEQGESYIILYKNIDKIVDQDLGELGLLKYTGEVAKYMRTEAMSKCMESVFGNKKFKDSKLSKFIEFLSTLNQMEGSQEEMVNNILAILDAKDFEHDYYKFTTFTMIETISTVNIHDVKLPEEAEEEILTEEEYKRALKIEIDKNQKLTVNNQETTTENIREKVVSYLKQNTSKSIIVYQISMMVEYGKFLKTQNEIAAGYDVIRNELAEEKYNRSYEELTKSEQEKIKETYPLRIKYIEIDE